MVNLGCGCHVSWKNKCTSGETRALPKPAWGTNGSPIPTLKFCKGNCRISETVRKVAGKGIWELAGCCELKSLTLVGENKRKLTGSSLIRIPPPLDVSQSPPNRIWCKS